ncbi:FBD-associated F-box protein At5g22730-like [Vicia villosa]|uniref:FBD-associated F-box protein At5g22730-like n=1 Tax=Vicia villosa TaxID=3911 RepID=UPI00273CB8C1|nr:FBD-associated F-box protein At5g22730-like [Vicia villosa]
MEMEDEKEDMISTLPDEILSHILSFLPTEVAFTTSLLSKRWKPIWLLVPNLNFDDQRFMNRGKPYFRFMDMIYYVICAKIKHRKLIKRFDLKCHENPVNESLETAVLKWLIIADKYGMEHLEFQGSDRLNFYNFIFAFSNLIVLKLKTVRVNYFLPVDFPSLKTLHLNDVFIAEHWYLCELVNSCPILEDFEAKDISVRYWLQEYNGKFKRLTNLVRADISNLNSCDVPIGAFSNVEFLRIEEMYGHVPVFPNLTHVELVFQRNVDWCWVLGVLEKFPKLQTLVLEMPQLLTSVKSFISIPSISPECLSSQFKECNITNYRGQEYELQFARYIMLNSTHLRRMTICSSSSMNCEEKLAMQMELLSFPKSSALCQIYFK